MEKLVIGQIVPGSEALRWYLSGVFGHCSWEEVEKTIPLESRGVRVLTKCSRRQIEIVATQTILKVDKRPGKHISLQQRIDEEHQGGSNINHTNWYEDQAISSKGNQQTMATKRSLGMRWIDTTDRTVEK